MKRIEINDLVFYDDKKAICAWEKYGIRMGDGFLDTLDEPLTNKSYISNNARLSDGVRITSSNKPKRASRDVTLIFTLEGDTPSGMREQKKKFFDFIDKHNGLLVLTVPELGDDVFRLYYQGKGSEYSLSLDRCFCKLALKFTEPNPTDRSAVV